MYKILLASLILQPFLSQPVHFVDSIPVERIEAPKQRTIKPRKELSLPKQLPTKVKAKTPIVGVQRVSGDWVAQCRVWAKQAGIPLPDIAITIIDGESDCNPHAQNPRSTAYGIGQFLDSTWAGVGCVKTSDPITQLKCMYKYVSARYGGWQGAYNHKVSKGWY